MQSPHLTKQEEYDQQHHPDQSPNHISNPINHLNQNQANLSNRKTFSLPTTQPHTQTPQQTTKNPNPQPKSSFQTK